MFNKKKREENLEKKLNDSRIVRKEWLLSVLNSVDYAYETAESRGEMEIVNELASILSRVTEDKEGKYE